MCMYIINVILEKCFNTKKVYTPKTFETDLNGEAWTSAISYDDADVQVNHITVTKCINYKLAGIDNLETLVCPYKV